MQGCGPIGLLQIATLRTLGIETIIAVDGNDSRLELAREMGASRTYNFTRYADLNELLDAVNRALKALLYSGEFHNRSRSYFQYIIY